MLDMFESGGRGSKDLDCTRSRKFPQLSPRERRKKNKDEMEGGREEVNTGVLKRARGKLKTKKGSRGGRNALWQE